MNSKIKRRLSVIFIIFFIVSSLEPVRAGELKEYTVSGGDDSEETYQETVTDGNMNIEEDVLQEDSVSDNEVLTEEMVTESEKPEIKETAAEDLETGNSEEEAVLQTESRETKQLLQTVASRLENLEAGEDYIEDEVVAIADSLENAEYIADCYKASLVSFADGVAVLRIHKSVKETMRVAASFTNDYPAVFPNYIYEIEEQETNVDEALSVQWHHKVIETENAWLTAKGQGVLVAVIDTGIDTDHPDLQQSIYRAESSLDNVSSVEDGNGHGTHVAGIIAAQAGNGIGGAGIAPEALILSIKAMADNGTGTTASIVRGIYLSLARGAKVINLSVSSFVYDEMTQKAVEAAVKAGCIVVGAAGNSSTNQKVYPAAYESVVAVGAIDEYENLSYFSNYGSWVDIAAPGSRIYSTVLNGGYGYKSGTSMAAPVVTATIALILSSRQELLQIQDEKCLEQVKHILLKTREEKSYSYGTRSIYGGVNAGDAVAGSSEIQKPEAPVFEPEAFVPGKKNTIYAGTGKKLEIKVKQPNVKIYYTTNGKNPTKTTGTLYTEPILLEKKGTITVKAVAIAGENVSPVTTAKYNLVALAESIIPVYGEEQTLLRGKSLKLQVQVAPEYTSNKKVSWELTERSSNVISLDKSTGTIKCSSKAVGGETAVVKVTAKDGSGVSAFIKVVVETESVQPTLNEAELLMTTISSAQNEILKEIPRTYQLEVFASGRNPQVSFSSSNKNVAVVDENGLIMAVGRGTAKIKATLKDGSNRSVICRVKVITPVITINTLKTSTGYYAGDELQKVYYGSDYIGEESIPIAKGCKISIKAYLNQDFTWRDNKLKDKNKPSNSKIIWSSDDTSVLTVKNGIVTCSKNAVAGQTVTITATAADGYGASQSISFVVCDKISSIYIEESGKKYKSGYTKVMRVGENIESFEKIFTVISQGKTTSSYDINISNPDIAATFSTVKSVVDGKVVTKLVYDKDGKTILALKKGTTKITFKARDGSKKSYSMKIAVK